MLRLNTFGGLWVESTDPGDAPVVKPRRLAVMAVLAAAGDAGASRDQLLGVLWPDRDEARARHALSQTLYSLRQDLGVEAVLLEPALRLDPVQIRSDLGEFREAIQRGEWDRAAALYRGPFLDGFYLGDAPGFDQWVEAQRLHCKGEAIRALEQALALASSSGDRRREAELASRLTELDPLSSRFALLYMEALVRLGDRAEALAHEQRHAQLVREALEAAPDPAVTAYAERLRSAALPRAGPASRAPPLPSEPVAPVTPVRPGRRRWLVTASLIAGAAALGLWAARGRIDPPSPRAAGPTLAVGHLRDLSSPDSAEVSRILADMLTTSLSRMTALEVVATSRLLELVPAAGIDAPDARTGAARRAGATEILEGEVARTAGGGLQLDLRRVDLRSGVVKRGYRVTGATRFDLVDSATAAIAADLRTPAPVVSIAELTTRSPLAYRFYEAGLRAFHQLDLFAASRFFHLALREDSTFALAAYYAWRSAAGGGDTGVASLAAWAMRLSDRASTRDRLLIQAHVAAARDDLGGLAAAESLAAVFPNDPEAIARAADIFRQAGEPIGRVTGLLDRATAVDSAASAGPELCRACVHLAALADVYREADSFPAAEAALLRWARFRPDDPAPWLRLGALLDAAGSYPRADSAYAVARRAGATDEDRTTRAVRRAAARGDRESVLAACRPGVGRRLSEGERIACQSAYRTLGRLREALLLARSEPSTRHTGPEAGAPVGEIMLDFEAGRYRLAAESFRRLASEARATGADGRGAADAARYLALAAAAHDERTDSLAIGPLVPEIAELERRALSGRRGRFSRFARALLLGQAGRYDEALVLLDEARSWSVADFPRLSRELARTAMAAGRTAEALDPLRTALRAPSEGWGGAVNHGDLHDLLGAAFAALGRDDSARAHYEWVARAWEGSDPPLHLRQRHARGWLDGRGSASP